MCLSIEISYYNKYISVMSAGEKRHTISLHEKIYLDNWDWDRNSAPNRAQKIHCMSTELKLFVCDIKCPHVH